MKNATILQIVLSMLLVGLFGLFAPVQADEEVRLFDRQIARVYSGSTAIDVSAATYTAYQNCLTIEPDDNHAMQDVTVVIDLDYGDSTYTDETIQFAVARKIRSTTSSRRRPWPRPLRDPAVRRLLPLRRVGVAVPQ